MKTLRTWALLSFFLFVPSGVQAVGPWCGFYTIAYVSFGTDRVATWIQKLRDETISTIDKEAKFQLTEYKKGPGALLEDLRGGSFSLGVFSVADLARVFPDIGVLDLPGLVTDATSVKHLYDRGKYLKRVEEQLNRFDLSILAITNVPYTLISTKKLTIPGLKDATIRVSTDVQAGTMKAFGASPVRDPSTARVYAALKAHTVTGALLPTTPVTEVFAKIGARSAIISPTYSRNVVLVGSSPFVQKASERKIAAFAKLAQQTSLEFNRENASWIQSLAGELTRSGIAVSIYSVNQVATEGKVALPELWEKLAGPQAQAYRAMVSDLRK